MLNGQDNRKALMRSIRGTVVDAASGYPIAYASVALLGRPGTGAISDSSGHFIIKNVPVGRHDIQASFVGYESAIFKEILVTSSKEVFLNIPLKEAIRELDEVTVRPSLNKEQPLNKMATTGARMLSVEEASRYAGGMDDPARLVSSFAGVSPAMSTNGISIHGNAPHLLQWRLEDVEIPNPNHFADLSILGGGILSGLSSHVLGNSDFFSGAFPAEFSNAVSGVFDMKLRNGNNRRVENTIQIGLLGMDFASEGPLTKKHNSSYIFNYRYSTTGILEKAGIVDFGGILDYQDLNFKFNIPTRKAGTFSVWGTGLIDKSESEFEKNPEEWEYLGEQMESETSQYMVAGGISHSYFFNDNTRLKTIVAATYFRHKGFVDFYDFDLNKYPNLDLVRNNTNLIFSAILNRKFSAKFTNKTGFTFTKMYYDMEMNLSPYTMQPLELISKGEGNTNLISGYTSSYIGLSDRVTLSVGLNAQVLTLNNHWTVEPRTGIKWQATPKASFALAYGLHSRMEKMDVYFVRTRSTGTEPVNKDLDFSKAHHVMLSYGCRLSDNLNLKIEPYFQHLFDIPVIADSSYSVLNRVDFYVEEALKNKGKGRNFGVDVTLERYLNDGVYYMISGSLFSSKYKGGDGKWRNTKYNRQFIINCLSGKEWMLGQDKQNILGINLKMTMQGGDRYSLVDRVATLDDPDKVVQHDETKAFTKQFSPMFIVNYTISYKINKKKVSHEFALKGLNATGCKEYYGHEYNFNTGEIKPLRSATALPNISYKLEF
ncbi:carboxypeptidase-like regulatory domain-containing protein [uncultured Butyricimonas sp.]|uniref:TonB-dependent receptor n=1 Tax=uncultured Butyricimonas sp. TaxID=1268785 RepID=UPI0026DC2EFD|nr:carboxypeptidase-like regulatory domain-containing protein [uncultured Butyricimonas sp.]